MTARGRGPAPDDEPPVLPEVTSDETDAGGGDWREDTGRDTGEDARDEWLRDERPPHWE